MLYRRCPHCHEVRSDVRRRSELVDGGALCDDCARTVGTPTMLAAEHREAAERASQALKQEIDAALALAGDRDEGVRPPRRFTP